MKRKVNVATPRKYNPQLQHLIKRAYMHCQKVDKVLGLEKTKQSPPKQ